MGDDRKSGRRSLESAYREHLVHIPTGDHALSTFIENIAVWHLAVFSQTPPVLLLHSFCWQSSPGIHCNTVLIDHRFS